jgi:ribose transport system ATP-binding protein
LLEVSQVSKAFAAPVLKDVALSVASGEVVALTGENGAGKSTLAKIIAGLTAPDSGSMQLGGKPYAPGNRAAAERTGVRMVLQELGLIGTLSIAENLLLGRIPSSFGFIRRHDMDRLARAQLARVGLFDVDPDRPVSDLGIGQQQLVEIARGLMGEARLLVLDEPTAMLTAGEIGHLFAQIEQLKARGVGVIYISHRLDELSRVADRVVVLRDGELIVSRPAREATHEELVQAMVGHAPAQASNRRARDAAASGQGVYAARLHPSAGREVLRIAGFSSSGLVRDVNLRLHAGEILGLAGLVGAGRTELLRMIFGADQKDAGTLYLDGTLEPVRIRSPAHAVARGIGLLTEDRKTQGLLLGQSVAANLTIANLGEVSPLGCLSPAREKSAVEHWTQRLRIRARDSTQVIDELSGGNQQKVLLARWLHRDCRVLLLDEPTRGIDVGARADIYAVLDSLAAQGKALLVVSSDLRELMEICDRIAVMSNGALVRTFERGQWSEQALLAAAFSAFGGAPNGATRLGSSDTVPLA